MIKIENTEVIGWEAAIRGMRNPMNSWGMSDSISTFDCDDVDRDCSMEKCEYYIDNGNMENKCDMFQDRIFFAGPKDHNLMMRLAKNGPVHAKYRRMIVVYCDITAPLYWWKEFDTYKVGTVANSCSTMHKIADKEFTLDDFSCEHLIKDEENPIYSSFNDERLDGGGLLGLTINVLNHWRKKYLETKDKKYWWQIIQLLPSSYNQERTIMLNYEVLAGIYPMRKDHKLDEWRVFCKWIEQLPYSEIITVGEPTHE